MNNINPKAIDLRHYKKEWHIIHKRIEELRQRKPKTEKERIRFFHNHLRSKLQLLAKDYKECPEYVLESISDKEKVSVRHLINLDVHKTFMEMSSISKIPITTIIERLIISPLLIEK